MHAFVENLKATFKAFGEDKVPRLASSIAYATIFALAPLLIVLIAIAGYVIGVQNGGHGHHVAEDAIIGQISAHAGNNAGAAVRDMIAAAFNKPRQSVTAQIIGWIAFIVGASGLFSALQDALNAVWHIEQTKGGWKFIVRDRLASFGMILVVGFLLLVSFGANAFLTFLSAHYFGAIPLLGSPVVAEVLNVLLNVGVTTCIFAAIFKILPDVDVKWRDVWTGAFFTGVLFVVGEALISIYISMAGVASGYGAAGSILVALVWIYYSAMIMLVGAEYTKVRARGVQTEVTSVIKGQVQAPAGTDPREKSASISAQ